MSLGTEKQQRFFAEYAVDQNGTQAAIRAGYSQKSAYVTASRLLKRAKEEPEKAKEQAKAFQQVQVAVQKRISERVSVAANTASYAIAKTLEMIEYGTTMRPVIGMFGPIIDPATGEPIMEMTDPRTATANIATLVKQFREFSEKHDVSVDMRQQAIVLLAGMDEARILALAALAPEGRP